MWSPWYGSTTWCVSRTSRRVSTGSQSSGPAARTNRRDAGTPTGANSTRRMSRAREKASAGQPIRYSSPAITPTTTNTVDARAPASAIPKATTRVSAPRASGVNSAGPAEDSTFHAGPAGPARRTRSVESGPCLSKGSLAMPPA